MKRGLGRFERRLSKGVHVSLLSEAGERLPAWACETEKMISYGGEASGTPTSAQGRRAVEKIALCKPKAGRNWDDFQRLFAFMSSGLAVCVLVVFEIIGGSEDVTVRAVELSMRMRGHDILMTHSPAVSHGHEAGKETHTTASPHSSSPQHPTHSHPASQHMSKRGEEIWKTEQAMKRQLDDAVSLKGGSLWKQTVDMVHKTDPNAKLISSFDDQDHSDTPSLQHGPHHARPGFVSRMKSKSSSMKARLERELNDKVGAVGTDPSHFHGAISKVSSDVLISFVARPLTELHHGYCNRSRPR